MTRELSNGINLKGPLQLSGSAGTSGQVLTSAGAGAVPTWAAASGFTGGTLTSNLTLAAGTTSLSPLTFQSGTNLTTATAGAMEYDGKVIYSTPAGRGVSPSMMLYRLHSTLAGADTTSVQSLFGVGVTLAASTSYLFQSYIVMQKTTGTTSHTVSLRMNTTTTVRDIAYGGTFGLVTSPSNGINSTTGSFYGTTVSSVQATSSIATASQQVQLIFQGSITTNLSPVLTPQYILSAAPGGAYTIQSSSYFAIWPIGAYGANTSVGPWA